jgi:hypothetical protein
LFHLDWICFSAMLSRMSCRRHTRQRVKATVIRLIIDWFCIQIDPCDMTSIFDLETRSFAW